MTDREIPITLAQYNAATQIRKEDPNARVAHLEEVLLVYLVTRHYETHSESWLIIETSLTEERPYMRHNFYQDRDGKWWSTYHFFHHTKEDANAWVTEYASDFVDRFDLYKVRYVRL